MTNYELHYDFDLLYDIKTKEELKVAYHQAKSRYESMSELIDLLEITGIKED